MLNYPLSENQNNSIPTLTSEIFIISLHEGGDTLAIRGGRNIASQRMAGPDTAKGLRCRRLWTWLSPGMPSTTWEVRGWVQA